MLAASFGGRPSVNESGDTPPEKGVADILVEAFQLYRRHARALLLTCALLFVPASLVKSCALSIVLGPTLSAVGSVQDLEALARSAESSRRALSDAYDRGADAETIARLQKENRRLLEEISNRTISATQRTFGSLGVALLGFLGTLITAFFLYGIIVPVTNGALTIAVADRILGGRAGWLEVWMLLFRRLDKLLSAVIPAALLIALGFLCLVIPGIVLAFLFAFVSPVVLIEDLRGRAALKRSIELVRADWLRVALVVVVFAVLQMVAKMFTALFVPHSAIFLDSLISDLFAMVLLPIPVLGAVLLYFDIRRKRDNFTDDRLRTDLAALRG
jgi:hypothetical protein